MDVWQIDGTGKQRRDFPWPEACDAAADARDQEGQLGMTVSESDELFHIGQDGVHAALHRRDGIALSLHSYTLSHDGTEFLDGDTSRTTGMGTGQVAAEDKDFVCVEAGDMFRRNAMTELAHLTVVFGGAVLLATEHLAFFWGHG